jgi:hypothetical protein
MATPTPEETQKQFERLQRLATALRKDLSQFDLSSLGNDAALVGELLEKWEGELSDASQSLDSISSSFQSVVSEISKGNKGLGDTKRSFNKLTSLAQDLQSHNAGINKLSADRLKSLEKQALKEKLKLQTTLDTLEADKQAIIEARRNGEQNAQQLDQLRKINAAQNEIKGTLNGQNQSFEDLITNARIFQQRAENLEDALGLGGNALKGMQDAMSKLGLGGLADKLGIDEANEAMNEMAAKLTNNGEKAATLGDKFKILGAGMKSAFSNLSKNLVDPKVLITEFVVALQQSDKAAGDLAKSFNITYSEALSTRRELSNMATLSGDVAVNTKGLQESMVAVGKSLGTNAQLNNKDLVTFTKLREQAGYTNEELIGIQKLSLVNGKTLEDNTAEILGGAEAYAARNGFVINEKDILKEVSAASASLKLTLGGSAEAVAKAAVQAKQFGLNLEQAEKISESLLQFETSIESELSAELLTGKNLNFERARALALEGKTAEAAAEVAKQVGTSRDFAKMNVIQQEALAKAAGMTRDELAQSLMDREALTKLSAEEGETAQEAFNRRVKEVGLEQTKKELGEKQLANQFAQQSVQDRFAQATEKLKEVFISMAEPVLAILTPLSDIVSSVLPLINVLLQPIVFAFQTIGSAVSSIFTWLSESKGVLAAVLGIATLLGVAMNYSAIQAGAIAAKEEISLMFKGKGLIIEQGKAAIQAAQLGYQAAMGSMEAKRALVEKKGLMRSIGEASMKLIGGFASLGPIGWLLGLAAAGTVAALGYKYMNDGVISPSTGGGGYGDRVLYGPEGAISFNDKDTIVAGTDLFKKGDDVVSAPKNTLSVSNKTAPKKEIKPVEPNMGEKFDRLIAAVNKRNEAAVLIQ